MANDLHLWFGHRDNRKGYMYNIIFQDNKESETQSFILETKNHINKDGYLYISNCSKLVEYIDKITN